jgi:hypothetical protein
MNWSASAARVAVRDLLTRRSAALVAGAVLMVALVSVVERRAAPGFALDRALLGPCFGLFLPFCCFVLTRSAFPTGIEAALGRLARLGVNRRQALIGRAGVLLGMEAIVALPLSLAALTMTGPTSSWSQEVAALVWVAPLAALGHGALLLLGASFGRFGALTVLLLDWLLGSGAGPLALPFPRAHVRNLLGGEAVLGFGQLASTVALILLCSGCCVWAARRTAP